MGKLVLGAFAGAAFAFLFMRWASFCTVIFERKSKNYNALARLQHYCNNLLNTTAENIFIANDFLGVFSEEKLAAKQPTIFFNRFHEFSINQELIISLTNIEVLNEFYTLNTELLKLNNSMTATNNNYEEIKKAFLEEVIDLDTYIFNLRLLREKITELKSFLTHTQSDIKNVFASIRVLHNDRGWVFKAITFLTQSHKGKKWDEDFKNELAKLEGEIDASGEASGERIRRVHEKK